jgi:hypothetical protein
MPLLLAAPTPLHAQGSPLEAEILREMNRVRTDPAW